MVMAVTDDDWLQLSTLRAAQTSLWREKQVAIEHALALFEPLWQDLQEKSITAPTLSDYGQNGASEDHPSTHSVSTFLPIDAGDQEPMPASPPSSSSRTQQDNRTVQTDADYDVDLLAALEEVEHLKQHLTVQEGVFAKERAGFERERALWEKDRRAAQLLPNRKERQETSMLKAELQQLVLDHKQREAKWQSVNDRLRDQVSQTKRRNEELIEEVATLEMNLRRQEQSSEQHQQQKKQQQQQQQQQSPYRQQQRETSQQQLLSGSTPMGRSTRANGRGGEGSDPKFLVPTLASPKQMIRRQTSLDTFEGVALISEMVGKNGRIERRYEDGTVIYIFTNGTTKEVRQDGQITFNYCNGDTKQVMPDGLEIYHFYGAKTSQITQPDGVIVYKFGNGQIETHYTSGAKTIEFPDGTVKQIGAR